MRTATVTALLVIVALCCAGNAIAAPSKTLDNLQAAYNGESNANAKYLEFAKKADAEGYKGVAALFRSAAKAEEFHARNHAEVITKMGAVPKKEIKLPAIGTTAENVKTAIEGETYERDKMYPEMIAEAKASNQADALVSFNFAIKVEAQHADLYTEALKNLDAWKTAKKFYVCPKCGETVTKLPAALCPICATSKEKFLTVE